MLDRYGREISYLRLSVTELCDLRCRYCMPEDGVCKKRHEDMLTEEETLLAVETAVELGIRKVRLTGGEPLVKKNILSLCRGIRAIPGVEELCLTTNAQRLASLAVPLREAGVDRINVSLDTLSEEKYRWITRGGELKNSLEGLDAALSAGFRRVKVNAVLIGGFNDDEIPALAGLTREKDVDVRFIELMPMVDGSGFGPEAYLSADAVLKALPQAVPVEGSGSGVARLYRLPGARGCIGLIQPLSDHFCGECNRLRLTADGYLKPCLHRPGEYSLKGLDKEGMRAQILAAVEGKPAWHGELDAEHQSAAARNMNEIGG